MQSNSEKKTMPSAKISAPEKEDQTELAEKVITQSYKTKTVDLTREQQELRIEYLHQRIGSDVGVFKELYKHGGVDIRNFFIKKQFSEIYALKDNTIEEKLSELRSE